MKTTAFFSSLMVLFIGMAVQLQAQSAFSVKSFKMSIAGTSSLHDWVSDGTRLTAEGRATLNGGVLEQIQSLQVTVPVKSIKSTKGKVMDDKTFEALKADAHPNIMFQLTGVESINPSGNNYAVRAKGNLTVAGVRKPIIMTVNATVNNDQVSFKGSYKINMLDYNMEPPKALMGTIKVGPEVTISFDLTMGAASL